VVAKQRRCDSRGRFEGQNDLHNLVSRAVLRLNEGNQRIAESHHERLQYFSCEKLCKTKKDVDSGNKLGNSFQLVNDDTMLMNNVKSIQTSDHMKLIYRLLKHQRPGMGTQKTTSIIPKRTNKRNPTKPSRLRNRPPFNIVDLSIVNKPKQKLCYKRR
jgi:hypothetical protein